MRLGKSYEVAVVAEVSIFILLKYAVELLRIHLDVSKMFRKNFRRDDLFGIFDSNYELTKIVADDDAVLSLSYNTIEDITGIEVGQELCSRSSSGSLDIYPSTVCS